MTNAHQRAVFALLVAAGIYGFIGLAESHGGIWKTRAESSGKETPAKTPSRDVLRAFFTADEPSVAPDSFQFVGNEVSIEEPPAVPEESAPAPSPFVAPVPEAAGAAAADEKTDFCTSGCSGGYHCLWCRNQQFWAKQSELSRERRLKNSRGLFKKSYYETFPAYHVENYGIYRTCWRQLPELDCCPEDSAEQQMVPAPAHSH
ncbi:MAG: hypothetical protein WEB58_16045 [Planctomycetaceae bacterium]